MSYNFAGHRYETKHPWLQPAGEKKNSGEVHVSEIRTGLTQMLYLWAAVSIKLEQDLASTVIEQTVMWWYLPGVTSPKEDNSEDESSEDI